MVVARGPTAPWFACAQAPLCDQSGCVDVLNSVVAWPDESRSQQSRWPPCHKMNVCSKAAEEMSAVESGQMSAVETGQMSAVETRQMSSAETTQM